MRLSKSLVQDVALLSVLVVTTHGLYVLRSMPFQTLVGTYFLALFIHIGFTLYLGVVGRARRLTWLLLIGAGAGSQIVSFAGYVLPLGQITFWLASNFPALGQLILDYAGIGGGALLLWLIPASAVLAADLLTLHYPVWRRRSALQVAAALAVVIALTTVFNLALPWLTPAESPDVLDLTTTRLIVPDWYVLPFFTILRAIPDKLAGVIAMFAAMVMPMIWPWARADILRTGRWKWLWLLLSLAFVAACIGLGYAGAHKSEGNWLLAARALTGFYFLFMLSPFLLRSLPANAGPASGRSAEFE